MDKYKYYKENNIKFPLTKEKMIYYLTLGCNVACWYRHAFGISYIIVNLEKGDNDIHIDDVHCLNRMQIKTFLTDYKLFTSRWLIFL